MTFSPVPYSLLRVNTLNLDAKLSQLMGRYQIEDEASNKLLTVRLDSLDILIARTTVVLECNTDRKTAREVFTKLVNELRQIPKESEEKRKEGTMFLLGALLHRYFRILKEYDQYNSYYIWAWNPLDCKLFESIRKALNLDVADLKQFRAEDLKQLDVTTIVSSLEVFRDNMLVLNEQSVPRYLTYPHFEKDKNFISYLQDIINEHTLKGKKILKQFQAVRFLHSLVQQLDSDLNQIESAMKTLILFLKSKQPNLKELDSHTIESGVHECVESVNLQEKVCNLLYIPLIKDNLNHMDYEEFASKMLACHLSRASYILYGGYLLLLQSKLVNENLKFCFDKSLGIDIHSGMSIGDMKDCLGFFIDHLEGNQTRALNCEFFDGYSKMESLLLSFEKELKSQENKAIEQVKMFSI